MFNSHVDQPQNHHVNENHLNSNYHSLPDPVALLRWGNAESALKAHLNNNLNHHHRFFPGLDGVSLLKWDGAEKVMNEYLDAVKSHLEQQEVDAFIFKRYDDELEHTATLKDSETIKRKQKDYDLGKKKAVQVLGRLKEVRPGQISEEKILNLDELEQFMLSSDAKKTTFKSQFAKGYYSYFIYQGEWSRLIDIAFPLSLVEPIGKKRTRRYKTDLKHLKDAKNQLAAPYAARELYQESIPVVNANNYEHQIVSGSQYEHLGNEGAPPAKKQKTQRTHNKPKGHQFFTTQSQEEENSIVPDYFNCSSSKCR